MRRTLFLVAVVTLSVVVADEPTTIAYTSPMNVADWPAENVFYLVGNLSDAALRAQGGGRLPPNHLRLVTTAELNERGNLHMDRVATVVSNKSFDDIG